MGPSGLRMTTATYAYEVTLMIWQGAAFDLIQADETPVQEPDTLSAQQHETLARKYGPGYYDLRKHIEACLLQSAGWSDGPKIEVLDGNGKKIWIPTGQYEAGDLYRVRGRGEITSDGFTSIQGLLRTPEAPAVDDDDDTRTPVRHTYRDGASAAANDYL